jgi:mycothiol system anti-sigma-R factor
MSGLGDDVTPDEIGCLEAIESLYAYLDGEIRDPVKLARIEHHLGHCRSCYSRQEMESLLTRRLRREAESSAPEALQARLRALMEKF